MKMATIISILFLFLFVFSHLLSLNLITNSELEEDIESADLLNYEDQTQKFSQADLDRVSYRANNFRGGSFEDWNSDYSPDGHLTSVTTEHRTFYAHDSSYPVNEGTSSLGFEALAIDPSYPSTTLMNQFLEWDNPANLTLSFDYYIDALTTTSIDGDNFEIVIEMDWRNLHYLIGSEQTRTNGSFDSYFVIEDVTQQSWNFFSRNLTNDYILSFSEIPVEFKSMYFYLKSYTAMTYSRVFIDDLQLINGTIVKIGGDTNNGNFNNIASWYLPTSTDLGIISRSTDNIEGDWSVNATVFSNSHSARSSVSTNVYQRLTALNKDIFSFNWKIAEWSNASEDTYSYLEINCENLTESFSLYLILCNGGASQMTVGGVDDIVVSIDDYNSTDTWNFFNGSIFDIVKANKSFIAELHVRSVKLYAYTNEINSSLSILLDDCVLESSIIGVMSFEDQNEVGSPIHIWNFSPEEEEELTVTDFAYTGDKAANLTLNSETGNTYYYGDFKTGYQPLTANSEFILDFNIYIDYFNWTSSQVNNLYLEIGYGEVLVLLIANSTAIDQEFDEFIIIEDVLTTGSWINIQIDILSAYLSFYDNLPVAGDDDYLSYISLTGELESGVMKVYFDDLYIYEDTAPVITDVEQSEFEVEAGDTVTVNATVIDATLETVELFYHVDSGEWNTLSMIHIADDNYQIEVPGIWSISNMEYYVNATDAYNKSTIALNSSSNYIIDVIDTIAPEIYFWYPDNGSIVGGMVEINMTLTETGSGIAFVNISIDGISLVNSSYPLTNFLWNTTLAENGEHNISITVQDNAGNIAQYYIEFIVENNLGANTDGDLLGLILIIVIIIGVLGGGGGAAAYKITKKANK